MERAAYFRASFVEHPRGPCQPKPLRTPLQPRPFPWYPLRLPSRQGTTVGARKGTITYSLFYVRDELPADYQATFLERIDEFRFDELKPDSEEDIRYGWTVLDDMLSTDFSRENVYFGEYLCLGMRTDRWALPAALLKAHAARREREVMEAQGKAKLFKSERVALREEVTRQLKQRMLPSAGVVDMVWSLERKEVRFWSQSARAVENFESLFESTFGLRLVHDNPYVAALNSGIPDTLVGNLADAEQSRFTSFE